MPCPYVPVAEAPRRANTRFAPAKERRTAATQPRASGGVVGYLILKRIRRPPNRLAISYQWRMARSRDRRYRGRM